MGDITKDITKDIEKDIIGTTKVSVPKLVIKGKQYPPAEDVLDACLAYFNLFKDESSELNNLGVMVFTQEGLNRISDVGMYNAIGITRQKWEAWKSSYGDKREIKALRNAVMYIEQILEQVDQERLSTRGNVGDLFRMKVKYKWRDKDSYDEKSALSDLSDDKTALILKRMARGKGTT